MEYEKAYRMIFKNKGTGLTGGRRRRKKIHTYLLCFLFLKCYLVDYVPCVISIMDYISFFVVALRAVHEDDTC